MKPLKNVPFRSLRLSAQSPRCIRPAGAGLEIFNPADNGKRFSKVPEQVDQRKWRCLRKLGQGVDLQDSCQGVNMLKHILLVAASRASNGPPVGIGPGTNWLSLGFKTPLSLSYSW